MKYSFLILMMMLCRCNSNQHGAKEKVAEVESDKCLVYPPAVDSLQLKDLYDSARWYIYTLQCDESYLPKNDTSKSITFGELPLIFDDLFINHDTLNLNFSFLDKGEPILFSMNRSGRGIVAGIGFNIKLRKKMYMIFPGGNVTYKGGTNRYQNPLQPEVLEYIKNNRDRLDACFRILAEKNGIKK